MKLKRFVAKDMREALTKIKEELGPDAVIMSNKRIDNGVEIVAGIETLSDSLSQKVKQGQKDSLIKDKESLERILTLAKAQRVNRAKKSSLEDDSVSISKAGASKALDDINSSIDKINKEVVRKKNKISSDTQASSLESMMEKRESEDGFANSLLEILERQQNNANANKSVKRQENVKNSQNIDEPPLPLSENSDFKSLFKKSKEKIEKEEQENINGIDSYKEKGSIALDDKDLKSVAQEVLAIRKLLQFELAGLIQENKTREEPVRAMIEKLLISAGFEPGLSNSLVQNISVDASFNFAWRELSEILESKICVGDDEIIKQGGIVSLIGPAGVGKTTTLAKLAARFVMRYGPERVAIVSADHYRIGAFEQVKTYGRIMGCSAFSVKSINELPEILYTLRDKSLVLVDTAGVGLKDERFGTQIAQLKMQSSLKLKHYLVLPATAQRRVLTQAHKHFSQIGLSGLILTKVDESQSLGDAISLSINENLPLSYVTDGQRVPEDLFVPNAHLMTIKALSYVEDDVARQIFKE